MINIFLILSKEIEAIQQELLQLQLKKKTAINYQTPSTRSNKNASLEILAQLNSGKSKSKDGLASLEVRRKHRSKLW